MSSLAVTMMRLLISESKEQKIYESTCKSTSDNWEKPTTFNTPLNAVINEDDIRKSMCSDKFIPEKPPIGYPFNINNLDKLIEYCQNKLNWRFFEHKTKYSTPTDVTKWMCSIKIDGFDKNSCPVGKAFINTMNNLLKTPHILLKIRNLKLKTHSPEDTWFPSIFKKFMGQKIMGKTGRNFIELRLGNIADTYDTDLFIDFLGYIFCHEIGHRFQNMYSDNLTKEIWLESFQDYCASPPNGRNFDKMSKFEGGRSFLTGFDQHDRREMFAESFAFYVMKKNVFYNYILEDGCNSISPDFYLLTKYNDLAARYFCEDQIVWDSCKAQCPIERNFRKEYFTPATSLPATSKE